MTNEEIAMRKRPQLQPRHLLDPMRPEPEAEPVVAVLEQPAKKKDSQASVVTSKWDNRTGSFVELDAES